MVHRAFGFSFGRTHADIVVDRGEAERFEIVQRRNRNAGLHQARRQIGAKRHQTALRAWLLMRKDDSELPHGKGYAARAGYSACPARLPMVVDMRWELIVRVEPSQSMMFTQLPPSQPPEPS